MACFGLCIDHIVENGQYSKQAIVLVKEVEKNGKVHVFDDRQENCSGFGIDSMVTPKYSIIIRRRIGKESKSKA